MIVTSETSSSITVILIFSEIEFVNESVAVISRFRVSS